eukprot:g1909.t1
MNLDLLFKASRDELRKDRAKKLKEEEEARQKAEAEATAAAKKAAEQKAAESNGEAMGSLDDIANRDDSERPTISSLTDNLEGSLRTTEEIMRKEHDSLKRQLRQKKRELAEASAELCSLVNEGRALGLHDVADDEERLQPLKSISTKPFFTRFTRLEDLEQELKLKEESSIPLITYTHVLLLVKERAAKENVELRTVNRDLQASLRAAKRKLNDVERTGRTLSVEAESVRSEMKRLTKNFLDDMAAWQRELDNRQKYVAEKDSMEKYCQESLLEGKKVEKEMTEKLHDRSATTNDLETLADDVETEEDHEKLTVGKVESKMLETKLSHQKQQIVSDRMANEMYKAAFARIGIDLDFSEPEDVSRECLKKLEINRDFKSRKARAEQLLEELKAQEKDASKRMQEAMFFSGTTTTNRMLTKLEEDVDQTRRLAARAHEGYKYLEEHLQPALLGIQHIAKKILGIKVAPSKKRYFDAKRAAGNTASPYNVRVRAVPM